MLQKAAVEMYLWGLLVNVRSSNVDLLRSFEFVVVGASIICERVKESHNY